MTNYISLLKSKGACKESLEFARMCNDAKTAWESCTNITWMIWALEGFGKIDDYKQRMFNCWCIRHTPLVDGRVMWDLLTDERSRNAVEVAERFASGNATLEELNAARDAAWSAYKDKEAWPTSTRATAAKAAALAAVNSRADPAWDAAIDVSLDDCAVDWTDTVTLNAVMNAVHATQCQELRRIYGFPFADLVQQD